MTQADRPPTTASPSVVSVIPVRSGILPVGAFEAVAEAGGRCWLIGNGCDEAKRQLDGHLGEAHLVEVDGYDPARWSRGLAPLVAGNAHIIIPFSPDGRDLAPHIAAALGRPLLAGATEVHSQSAVVARRGGLTMERLTLEGPVVATLQIGVRNVPEGVPGRSLAVETHTLGLEDIVAHSADDGTTTGDVVVSLEELPADPATMDLAEAPRIIAGGAGLGTAEHFAGLDALSRALGASVGATRVVTDWGWLSSDRQIGTTGVAVDPDLYVAIGISGAVQHTAGLGNPDHLISVNTDPSCPMMELADIGIVCDGPAFVAALTKAMSSFRSRSSSPSSRRGPDHEA